MSIEIQAVADANFNALVWKASKRRPVFLFVYRPEDEKTLKTLSVIGESENGITLAVLDANKNPFDPIGLGVAELPSLVVYTHGRRAGIRTVHDQSVLGLRQVIQEMLGSMEEQQ